MQVQRINVTIVSGKDVILESEEFNLERILRQDIPQNSSLTKTESASEAEPKASETLIE
jgi:hypothetical protein